MRTTKGTSDGFAKRKSTTARELLSSIPMVRTFRMAPFSSTCAPRCRYIMPATAIRITTNPMPKVIRNCLLRIVGRSPGS